MSISYEDLSLEIAGRLRIDSTDRDRFKIQDSINHAQRFLLNTLDIKYLNNAIKTVRGQLLNGEALYQLPSDFIRHVDLWLSYDSKITHANPGKEARLEHDILIENRNNPASTAHPKVSFNAENGFEIRPIPEADQEDGWRLRYIYNLPDVNSSQNLMLKDSLRPLVVLYASALSALVDGYSESLSKEYMALFNFELEKYLPRSETPEARS